MKPFEGDEGAEVEAEVVRSDVKGAIREEALSGDEVSLDL